MMLLVAWVFRRSTPSKVDRWFRRLQLVSAGAYSLGHGGNDAQKTIGIIWMMLIATGYVAAGDSSPPAWTVISCYAAIGAGTMFGGWRIVKTMGQKITKLKPVHRDRHGHSRVHHAHHHRSDCGRRFVAPCQCCALGCGGQYRLGLDFHHPGQCVRGHRVLLGQFAVILRTAGVVVWAFD
jgi:hypothetical protein